MYSNNNNNARAREAAAAVMKKNALVIRPTDEESKPKESAEVITLPSTEFVAVEKNLASLGFFSPTSKNVKNVRVKTITGYSRDEEGKRAVGKILIKTGGDHGLPTTAHQDKYIAFQKMLESRRRYGVIANPVSFSSAEMLQLLDLCLDSGKNYDEVTEFLDVMTSTTIKLEGKVYIKGKRATFKADTFHVFDRVVAYGKELEDGTRAQENFVWLSEWTLENVNDHYTVAIDFETYKRLQNAIAKALVPHLQVWLYASEGERSFSKRYDELCQLLSIRQWNYESEIKRHLSPALDELKSHGYLKSWKLEKAADGYKVVFYHGEKYFRDRAKRIENKQEYRAPKLVQKPPPLELPLSPPASTSPVEASASSLSPEQEQLYKQLTGAPFSVSESKAHKLVTERTGEATKQLGAYPLKKNIPQNPGGYIIRAIEHRYFVPPAYFEAQRKAEETKNAQVRRDQIAACRLCDVSGFRMVKTATSQGAKKCSHDPEIEARYPSL